MLLQNVVKQNGAKDQLKKQEGCSKHFPSDFVVIT